MVNSCKSTQAVVTNSKIWIVRFRCHVTCNQESIVNINMSIWKELDITIITSFKLKQGLFLPNFSEVEFSFIKGLEDFINS
jgi:hypothetical protein